MIFIPSGWRSPFFVWGPGEGEKCMKMADLPVPALWPSADNQKILKRIS
jgi:hypothetical protein